MTGQEQTIISANYVRTVVEERKQFFIFCRLTSIFCSIVVQQTQVMFHATFLCAVCSSGAGVMEADDRQVTTVFTVQPSLPSALDKPSIMKRYHRRRTCSHTSPRRSPTMVTLHDTGYVEYRWWNDGWTVKTVVT